MMRGTADPCPHPGATSPTEPLIYSHHGMCPTPPKHNPARGAATTGTRCSLRDGRHPFAVDEFELLPVPLMRGSGAAILPVCSRSALGKAWRCSLCVRPTSQPCLASGFTLYLVGDLFVCGELVGGAGVTRWRTKETRGSQRQAAAAAAAVDNSLLSTVDGCSTGNAKVSLSEHPLKVPRLAFETKSPHHSACGFTTPRKYPPTKVLTSRGLLLHPPARGC